jgi:hypothetical protein
MQYGKLYLGTLVLYGVLISLVWHEAHAMVPQQETNSLRHSLFYKTGEAR